MTKTKAQDTCDSLRRSWRGKEMIDVVHAYVIDGADIDPGRADKALRALEFVLPKLKAIDHTSGGDKIKTFDFNA